MKKLKNLTLVVIYGPPGAGKTTLADLLHSKLSYTAHIGVDHIKRFVSEFREIKGHQDVSKSVVNAMADEYLKNNISVIVEQGMGSSEIIKLKEIADKHSADFFVYRLEASHEILDQRVIERTTKLGRLTIPKETIDELRKSFQENEYPSTRIFNSDVMSAEEKTEKVLEDLQII